MKYVVIHKPSGEEVDPGTVIYDPLSQRQYELKGVGRSPAKCSPIQAPTVVVSQGFGFELELTASTLQLEVVEVRVERFTVTVTRGPNNPTPFQVSDMRYALEQAGFPNLTRDGELQFEIVEVPL